jgi:hypothetical protein
MLFHPKYDSRPNGLLEQIRRAVTVTPGLLSEVIATTCVRLPTLKVARKAHLDRLIEVGAWTEAVNVLIELELPQWKLRRLVYEDGEWHCCLSLQPNLPVGLDETAEASHEVLPLAMLGAFLDARQRVLATRDDGSLKTPRVRQAPEYPICCDNFI